MLFLDQNSKFHGIKELQVPKKAPPSPKNAFFGPKKNFENFFQKVRPKTRCLTPKPTFYHL